jgi:hypothetical protein
MADRQQDFWNLVRILLDSIQAGEPLDDARLKLREIIHDLQVNSDDAARAVNMFDGISKMPNEKGKR